MGAAKRVLSQKTRRLFAAIERENAIAQAFFSYARSLDGVGKFAAIAEQARQQAIEHLDTARLLAESAALRAKGATA